MELGISAGSGLEADLRTGHADASRRAVTDHILALAERAGYGAALIDAVTPGSSEASVITWPQFVLMIRAAADGLSRRGLREDDAAGVFVHDAVRHVIAVHAIRAAGASAAPVRPAPAAAARPEQAVADIAAQLKRCRARLLITSAELADLAVQAAERSLVRQVFAFGEAQGTMPFGSLLHTARHGQVHPHDGAAVPDGDAMAQVLGLAPLGPDGAAARLTGRDVVVAAPPCGDPYVYTSLLDLALAAGAPVVAATLAQVPAAVTAYKGTAAVVPRGTEVPGLAAGRVFAVS